MRKPQQPVARSRPVPADFLTALGSWLAGAGPVADEAVRQGLLRWVPEYVPMQGRPALKVVTGALSADDVRRA